MWKCKQCGSEILAVITGFTTLDKNGEVPKNTVYFFLAKIKSNSKVG